MRKLPALIFTAVLLAAGPVAASCIMLPNETTCTSPNGSQSSSLTVGGPGASSTFVSNYDAGSQTTTSRNSVNISSGSSVSGGYGGYGYGAVATPVYGGTGTTGYSSSYACGPAGCAQY